MEENSVVNRPHQQDLDSDEGSVTEATENVTNNNKTGSSTEISLKFNGGENQPDNCEETLTDYHSGICLCSICPDHPLFPGEKEFTEHFSKLHKNEAPFDATNNANDRSKVGNSGHGVTTLEVVACPECPDETYFLTAEQLELHIHKNHRIVKTKDENEMNSTSSISITESIQDYLSGACLCSICPEHPLFAGETEFIEHYNKFHGSEMENKAILNDSLDDTICKVQPKGQGEYSGHGLSNKKFLCTLCKNKTYFSKQSKLLCHIKHFHGQNENTNDASTSLSEDVIDDKSNILSTASSSKSKESLDNLEKRLKHVTKKHKQFEEDKATLQEDLNKFRLHVKKSGSYIERILQKEIDVLTTCQTEQATIMSEIQRSIDRMTSINDDVSESMETSNKNIATYSHVGLQHESNVKVSHWLKQHSEMISCGMTFPQNENNTKIVQAKPEVIEKSIQTSSEWIYEQEKREKLLENIKLEKDSLTNLVQHKSMCMQELQQELEGLRRTETNVNELEDELEKVKSQSKLELDAQAKNSKEKMKAMEIERKVLDRKLKEYTGMMKDFKAETKNLQLLCQNIRSDASKERNELEKKLQMVQDQTRQKTVTIDELQEQVKMLSEQNERSKNIQNTLERRKNQLCLDANEMKTTITKLKDEKQLLSSKLASIKGTVREKSNDFNEKIDNFMKNEKLLKIEIKRLSTKTIEKEDLIKSQDTQIQLMKREVKDASEMKRRYNDQITAMKESLHKEEKSRNIISEKFVALEEKHKTLWHDHIKLEERSKCHWNTRNSEIEASKRETQLLKDENYELRQQYDLMRQDHDYCAKKRQELERDIKYKEGKLRDEMEIVLKDASTEYQKQIDCLKAKLCKLEQKRINQCELESKIEQLVQENRTLRKEIEESVAMGAEEKKRFTEEYNDLQKIVLTLENEKKKLSLEKEFLEEKVHKDGVDAKEKEENTKSEMQYFKDQLCNTRERLQEQLLVTKRLQEEKQDGGLPWQEEKRDLLKQLEVAKEKAHDSEIDLIISKEKCSKVIKESQVRIEKRDMAEKGLREQIEREKRNYQKSQEECAKEIANWVKKQNELEKINADLNDQIKNISMECDLKLVKQQTSEQINREECERLRKKYADVVAVKEKLEKENREYSFKVTNQQSQLDTLSKETSSQARYLEKIDETIDDHESTKLKLKKENAKLNEKLRQLQFKYEKIKMELSRNSTETVDNLEEENEKLKREFDHTKSTVDRLMEELKISEKEKDMLDKRCQATEDRQHQMQRYIEKLQFKIKSMCKSNQNELSSTQEQQATMKYTYENELQEKVEQISRLDDQLRTLQQHLMNTKSAQYQIEVKSLRNSQSQLNTMSVVHDNEMKTKEIAINLLKKELKETQGKLCQLSNENITRYEQEVNELIKKHAEEMQTIENQNSNLRKEVAKLKKLVRDVHDSTTTNQFEKLSANYMEDLKDRDQVIIQLNQQIASLKEDVEGFDENKAITNNKTLDNVNNDDTVIKTLKNQIVKLTTDNTKEIKSRDELIKSLEEKLFNLNVAMQENSDERVDKVTSTQNKEIMLRDETIASLKSTITNMKETTARKDEDDSQREALKTNHEAELKSSKIIIESLKEKIASLSGEVHEAQEMREILAKNDKELQSSNQLVDSLKEKIKTMKETVDNDGNVQHMLENYKLELESRDQNITHLTRQIAELKSSLKEIDVENCKKVDDLKIEYEIELKTRDQKVTELKRRILELSETKQTDNGDKEAQLKDAIESRDKIVDALRAKIQDMKSSTEASSVSAKNEIWKLQEELKLKQNELEEIQTKLQQKEFAERNNTKVKQLKNTIDELASENRMLTGKLMEARKEMTANKEDTKSQNQVIELRNERDAIIKEKNHLAEQVTVLLQKLNLKGEDKAELVRQEQSIKIDERKTSKPDARPKSGSSNANKMAGDKEGSTSNLSHEDGIHQDIHDSSTTTKVPNQDDDSPKTDDKIDNVSWDSSDDETDNEEDDIDVNKTEAKSTVAAPTARKINVTPAGSTPRVIHVAPAPPKSKVIKVEAAPTTSKIINVAPAPPESKVIKVDPAPTTSKIINVAPAPPKSKVIKVEPAPTTSKIINVAPAPLKPKPIDVSPAGGKPKERNKEPGGPPSNVIKVAPTSSRNDGSKSSQDDLLDDLGFDLDNSYACPDSDESDDKEDVGSLTDLLAGLDDIDSNRNKM